VKTSASVWTAASTWCVTPGMYADDDTVRSMPPQNLQLVEKVKEIAARKGCTPGQLALAWVHAQGEDVFPIPGELLLSCDLNSVPKPSPNLTFHPNPHPNRHPRLYPSLASSPEASCCHVRA